MATFENYHKSEDLKRKRIKQLKIAFLGLLSVNYYNHY